MDYRTGKCSQCGAEYKVPASFAHNVARCKKCQGVVHLSGASAPVPPAPAAAMPAKRVVPKAEAIRPPAPEARKPEGALPPRPATPKPAGATPTPPKGGALERIKGERGGRPEAPRVPAPEKKAPVPVGKAASAGAARRGAPEPAEAGAGRERRGARGRGDKKKTPVGGLVALGALVVVVLVLVVFRGSIFGGGDASASAAPAATPETAATSTAPAAEPAAAPADLREPAAPEPEVVETPPAEAEKPAPKAAKDPASIDRTAIPDFQPTPDTTPEEWARMNEQIAVWMDVEAGAAGNRAKLELIKQGRKAMPVILNAFKGLDFATKDGRSNGDQCQKTLMQICNGTNFDWKHPDEAAGRPLDDPDDVWFCKRVVELWANSWKQAEQDIKAWIKIAKLEEKDPAEAQRLLAMFGTQSSEPAPTDDDLEVD